MLQELAKRASELESAVQQAANTYHIQLGQLAEVRQLIEKLSPGAAKVIDGVAEMAEGASHIVEGVSELVSGDAKE